jgi:repressor LexA
LTECAQLGTCAQVGILTEMQQAVLSFIVGHQEAHGRPPSSREICEEFGFASHTAARNHLKVLARKGFVSQTGDGRTWAASKVKEVQGFLFTVPVFGTIPAGIPTDSAQGADETIRIDPALFKLRSAKDLFALHVRGDSMIDAQIADGDVAILRQSEGRPGQIVAALIDGQTTLKRLTKKGARTFLRAENKLYRDLIPSDSLLIQGVLVGVIGRGKR